MPLTPLDPGARAGDRAFDEIQAAILSGELPVGYRLRIRDLAAELGTSTMPIREAIRRLEEQGLAASEPYRGAVVKGFTDKELLDLYAVRTLLETDATALGITRLDSAQLQHLEDELAAMRACIEEGDAAGYLGHDEEFLRTIYTAAGNDVMVEMIDTLWRRCRPYKVIGAQRELAAEGDPDALVEYQEQLLQAARDRDLQRGRQAAVESLGAATRRIRRGLGATAAH